MTFACDRTGTSAKMVHVVAARTLYAHRTQMSREVVDDTFHHEIYELIKLILLQSY
jgi:hypothetical protein